MGVEEVQIRLEEVDVAHSGDELWNARRLGGIIKGVREGRDITRQEDAVVDIRAATGYSMSVSKYGDIENGVRLPNLGTLLAIMIAYDMHFEELTPAVVPEYREAFRKMLR